MQNSNSPVFSQPVAPVTDMPAPVGLPVTAATPKKGGSKLLTVLLVILALVILIIIVYLVFFRKQLSPTVGSNTDVTTTPTPALTQAAATDNSALTTLTGTYISARFPQGWTFSELQNGEGNDSLSGDGLTGLTGIQIQNNDGVTLFRIDAMYGVGGTSMCNQIYKFNDTPQAYIDARTANNDTNWGTGAGGTPNPPGIVDLTAAAYTQLDLLGHEIRIVGTTIYWNDDTYSPQFNNAFVPLCDEDALGFPGLADISFKSPTEPNDHNYTAEIVGNPTAADLLTLEQVLRSLKAN
jgi:hypothetical protein